MILRLLFWVLVPFALLIQGALAVYAIAHGAVLWPGLPHVFVACVLVRGMVKVWRGNGSADQALQ